MPYYTYILRCKDNSLYTGITTNPARRFQEHLKRREKGSKYAFSRIPVHFEAAWKSSNRSDALKLEYRIKGLTKAEKEGLIKGEPPKELDLSVYTKIHITDNGGINMLFICYPKCTTCRKAKTFLDSRDKTYKFRDIKTDNPTENELRNWYETSGLPLKRFFNTSGSLYRKLGLSKKLSSMSDDEQLALLASDGMLVKRPILIGDGFVLVGFKETDWEKHLD